MNGPILESSVSMSPENRDKMRPSGVVSKKTCGDLRMHDKRILCISAAPRNTPMLLRKWAV